jgi:hypothetical protein
MIFAKAKSGAGGRTTHTPKSSSPHQTIKTSVSWSFLYAENKKLEFLLQFL